MWALWWKVTTSGVNFIPFLESRMIEQEVADHLVMHESGAVELAV